MPASEELAKNLIHSRQTVLPRRLVAPGPSVAQQEQLWLAAAAAPDHGQITPWRLVLVPPEQRALLAEVFAQALLQRDAAATVEELERAREKAHRAPLLALAIARLQPDAHAISNTERLLSAGCAIQNVLLLAHAQGFGAALTSGKALDTPLLAHLFGLAANEVALCFLSIGTVKSSRARTGRPPVAAFVSVLGQASSPQPPQPLQPPTASIKDRSP